MRSPVSRVAFGLVRHLRRNGVERAACGGELRRGVAATAASPDAERDPHAARDQSDEHPGSDQREPGPARVARLFRIDPTLRRLDRPGRGWNLTFLTLCHAEKTVSGSGARACPEERCDLGEIGDERARRQSLDEPLSI